MSGREWRVQGRNGRWYVDEARIGESGVRSTVFVSNRRQDAQTVAYALNAAYAAGMLDLAEVSRETVPHPDAGRSKPCPYPGCGFLYPHFH